MRPFDPHGLRDFLINDKGLTLPTQAMDRLEGLPPEQEVEAPDPGPVADIYAKLDEVFDFDQVPAEGFVPPMMPDLPFDDFG